MEPSLPFCKALPKAELHAHLHGSIRNDTLLELIARRGLDKDALTAAAALLSNPRRSLSECFRIFDLIHAAVGDAPTIRRITRECIADFAADRVTYLELRTTPRLVSGCAENNCSHDSGLECYIRTVVTAVTDMERDAPAITVRLLLSINRAASVADACRTVALAVQLRHDFGFMNKYIVGLDVSGDPTRSDLSLLLPALTNARQAGLRISIHCGEVMNVRETELVLDFAPDRLGHMCVLVPSSIRRLLSASPRIPIEFCPTSNALTLHLPALHHHPTLDTLLEARYPLVVCTDDSGVFDVTLSSELHRVWTSAKPHGKGMCVEDVAALALQAFDCTFSDPDTALRVKSAATVAVVELLRSHTDEGDDGSLARPC